MTPRLFLPECAHSDPTTVALSPDQSHYLLRVLRLATGDALTVFDGQGREALATVAHTQAAQTALHLGPFAAVSRESPIAITVIQALCAGDKMDWVVQKATELGAAVVWPVQAQRSLVRLDPVRAEKRRDHWQRIAEAAAAQSGRNHVPQIASVQSWQEALQTWQVSARRAEPQTQAQHATPPRTTHAATGWLLDPGAAASVSSAPLAADGQLTIAIGPEAGFTDPEAALAQKAGFVSVRCGPRVLRTETAAAAVLAAVATRIGEF